MLVRFTYESNALAAFLAIWRNLPSKPKIASRATSSTEAGGDPVRKVCIKPAGGDRVCTPSDVAPKAKAAQQEAAGDHSKATRSASESEARSDVKKRKGAAIAAPKRKRIDRGSERINKKAMPEGLDHLLFNQSKDELKRGGVLQTEKAIETVSRLARFPSAIQPGDWFKTRPGSMDTKKPVPKCREILVCAKPDDGPRGPRRKSQEKARQKTTPRTSSLLLCPTITRLARCTRSVCENIRTLGSC